MIIVGSTNSMDHMAELSNTIFDSGLIGKEVRIRIYSYSSYSPL
jgi:hypothetical protein